MKKFISLSGGVESTALCVLFGNVADAIFADTKNEHKHIYERLIKIENWVKANIRPTFKIHYVTNKKHPKGLRDYIIKMKFYPSFKSRYCTRLFKIEPIDDFLKKIENPTLLIGLNYDEQDSRTGNYGLVKKCSYEYPLIENRLTRSACKTILNKVGLLPNFPVYSQRGGCIDCYFKSVKEYEAMALLNETEFDIVMHTEEIIQDVRGSFFSIKKGIKMREIKQRVSNILFAPEEIYPVINDVTSCGVFCNR